MSAASWLFMIALVLAGCDASSPTGPPTAASVPASCVPGEHTLDDGTCRPVELPPDVPCPPGELLLDDGITCQKAGVPPSACGAGFLPDGKEGCEPIAPADPCPAGQMAVPGDAACREVVSCGRGAWGDIPVEANTHYVDQAYAGGDSDGTQAKPWTRIQQGVNAAANGAIVAVAAGSYAEDVILQGKPVRLWGRCPAMVEVVGTGAELGAILVQKAANGAEIHGIAATGPRFGVGVSSATHVVIDGVWIHDTGYGAVDIKSDLSPTSVTIKGSLLEHNHNVGVLIVGSQAVIKATAVRSTLPGARGAGRSIEAWDNSTTKERAVVTVRGCLVEQNHDAGVFVVGSDALIEATVVRSTSLNALGELGHGIHLRERAIATVRACLLDQNHSVGVYVLGSDASIEATVIRSTLPDALGAGGRGINIQSDPVTRRRPSVTVRACLVDRNREVGVFVGGSDAAIALMEIGSTLLGSGAAIQDTLTAKAQANVAAGAGLLEQSDERTMDVGGAAATIEATVIRSTLPNALGYGGRGVNIQRNPYKLERLDATVRNCLVEQNHDIGVFISGSDVTLVDSRVRGTVQRKSDDKFGDGIAVFKGAVMIRNVDVTGNARAGVSSFGSEVVITGCVITCNGFDLGGEPFGDIPFTFDGSAGWRCSEEAPAACTDLGACHVETNGIEAPSDLPPADPLPQ